MCDNGAASLSGGAFVMPPKNDALKKEEDAALYGADLKVSLQLPNGTVESFKVKTATEVGYVKLLLAQKLQMTPKETHRISLFLDGKKMLDPMSLCDYPGISPPETNVNVEISE